MFCFMCYYSSFSLPSSSRSVTPVFLLSCLLFLFFCLADCCCCCCSCCYSSCLKKRIFLNFLSPSPAPTSPSPLHVKIFFHTTFFLIFSAFLFSATGPSSIFRLMLTPHARHVTSPMLSLPHFYPSVLTIHCVLLSHPPTNCPSSLFCLHSHCIHQILESVHHIHQHDIVHRDLKVSICRGASASNLPNPRPLNLCLLPFMLSVLFPLSILPPPCHVYRCRSCVRPSDSFLSDLGVFNLFYPFV